MGIGLVKGRLMAASDDSLAPKVVVINEAMANALWPRENPIGRTLDAVDRRTVIGVVRNVHDGKLDEESGGQMYFPAHEMTLSSFALVARGPLAPKLLLARLRDAVRATDPSQAVYHVRMMEEVVSTSVAPRRTQTILISTFGALGLLLAAFGVYGIVAYGIAQRTRELGIRAALGATGPMLVRHVAREGLVLSLAGIVVGVAGAWAATRLLTSLLFAVSPTDPWTFVLAPLTLFAAVALATVVPARRAARLDVMDVMRTE
jgi:putative ABC transport system permease protein